MVGLIGAGLLGSALAERFIADGHKVAGYDTDPACRQRLAALGGHAADSAVAVAAAADRLVFSLPNSSIVTAVLDEITGSVRRGMIVMDTTTGDPEVVRDTARRLAEAGVSYLDATVGGSSRQVRRREALVMCGGDEPAFNRCSDLFACFASQTFYVGPAGSGSMMKLVFNLVLGLNRAVLAEGLAFAAACGLRPEAALPVLRAGAAYSRAMDIKGGKMLARDFTPEARLSQHLKDVRLILEAGERNGARLPLSALHRSLLEEVERAGFGAEDNSAIIRAFLNAPDSGGI